MNDTINILFPIKTQSAKPSETDSVNGMMAGLKKLIELGALTGSIDELLLNYTIDNNTGYITASIRKSGLIDASKLTTVGSTLSYPIDLDDISKSYSEESREFSTASIQERLRISNLDPKMRFKYIIMDYKRYYNSNKSKLEKHPEWVLKLKDMFLIDVMGLFVQLMPALQEGKQLSQLTGLNNVSEGLLTISKDLSLAYRRALKQAKEGQISKANFQTLQKKYSEFMNLLIPQIFPGIDKMDFSSQKSYSVSSDKFEWVKISTTCSDKLRKLLEAIQSKASSGHSFDVIVDPESDPVKVNIDGDGSDRIDNIDSGKVEKSISTKIVAPSNKDKSNNVDKSSSYSYTSEGRIRLFS